MRQIRLRKRARPITLYYKYKENEVISREEFLERFVTIHPLYYIKGCKLTDVYNRIHWIVNDYEDLCKQLLRK